jgi:hypothetical protein
MQCAFPFNSWLATFQSCQLTGRAKFCFYSQQHFVNRTGRRANKETKSGTGGDRIIREIEPKAALSSTRNPG